MRAGNERGAILVATLLVLVLLSLLGAGALMSVTIQTKAGGNLGKGLGAFYAAESGLEVGAAKLIEHFTTNLSPYAPTGAFITPSNAIGAPFDGSDFNGYTVRYKISDPFNPGNPTSVPQVYPFTTALGGQQLINFSYQYKISSTATNILTQDSETTSEILRVFETPLIQYYIFFNDDLSWHNGPQMNSWGRVHTNGDFYYAAQSDTYFRNYDTSGNLCPNTLTVHGDITVGSYLAQAAAVFPASGTLSRAANPLYVRINNMNTVPAGSPSPNPPAGDCRALPGAGINSTNKATQEELFKTVNNDYLVRTGVDSLPVVSFNSLKRDGASTGTGFYERTARTPLREGVDGMLINADGGALQILLTQNGRPTVDVTNLVRDFQVQNGIYVNLGNWPADAKRRAPDPVGLGGVPADSAASTLGANNPVTDMVTGSIVYSPEAPVRSPLYVFYNNGVVNWRTHKFTNAAARKTANYNVTAADNTEFDHNPWYPCVMEIEDGRENREVDFTVIDMQLLQYWYYDYLDWNDDNNFNNSPDTVNTTLLIYATRSQAGSNNTVAGSGVNALQAIKLIGGQAGRIHSNRTGGAGTLTGAAVGTRQSGSTYRFRTTLVTPEPVYFVGDFNAPFASATPANNVPGMGSAVVSDSAIFISNGWNHEVDTFDKTGGNHVGAGTYTATDTTYNTAFFTGRYNYRQGGGGEEGGIHNFTRFNENWGGGKKCTITGCLINLWFSERADAPHGGAYYSPPDRVYGWDTGFASYTYWPPYVPSSYSIERSVWQEN